ncbi:MAG: hypothetical protein WB644_00490 [Candidatus Cybelea sp.]
MRRRLAPQVAIAMLAGVAASASAQTTSPSGAANTDPYVWLEDVHGARAIAWVKAENAKTLAALQTDPNFSTLYAQALAIAQAKDRVPVPAFIAGQVYNFWQDDEHVRGIWRHTTPADYASASPNWTTTLDLDELATAENANWVWKGADCVWPAENRCLIFLSDGGEDAVTVREFDLTNAAFVKDGFTLTHGKQNAAWEDADTLLVSREWSPGDLTASGYPLSSNASNGASRSRAPSKSFAAPRATAATASPRSPCTTVQGTAQPSSRGRSRPSRPSTIL